MKPIHRYRATFADRSTGAPESLVIEAKSDRGAARIAAGYEVDHEGFAACRLVGVERRTEGGWRPVEQELVSKATHWMLKEVVKV